MPPSYNTAQLHTLLPGPDGTHACLALYDVCPHSSHQTAPYLHYDLPSPRNIDHNASKEIEIHETTHSTLSQGKPPTTHLARLLLSKHSPILRHIRHSPASTPSTLNPPTVYLLTFSTDRTPSTRSFAQLLNTHLPPRTRLLYTIDARAFLVPPMRMCELYSGVARAVQEVVVRDEGARREIQGAVEELVRVVRVRGEREVAVAVAVCCTAGTHRSVAVAELIGLGVRSEVRRVGSREGVRVVVRHVHRVRGVEDPY
ncbi:hypothetical protein EKO04_005231 [Ascochyta lentis]|uniref:RapZ C-terminal domain-containing protein n=1 Tax=Ascochyta lentis TaxID=205686 RepID=A0A8H7J787_9PLEO|nr:hypothetical protein EKO04_005231 [Ascochyta lentis]